MQEQRAKAQSVLGQADPKSNIYSELPIDKQLQNKQYSSLGAKGDMRTLKTQQAMLNYSILTAELEQEQCDLEDLHMFFVAFNRKQRRIIERAENGEETPDQSGSA